MVMAKNRGEAKIDRGSGIRWRVFKEGRKLKKCFELHIRHLKRDGGSSIV
jgi:hypothetical protein